MALGMGRVFFHIFSCLSSFLFCNMGLLFLLRQSKPKVSALEGRLCSCSFVLVQMFWPFEQRVAAGKEFMFCKPIVYPALLLFLSHLLLVSISNTFSLRGKEADLGIRARHESDSSELK